MRVSLRTTTSGSLSVSQRGRKPRKCLSTPRLVRDQFHEERTSCLGHAVHSGIERDRVGIIPVERIAQAEPDIEVLQQVLGGKREVGEVDRPLGAGARSWPSKSV